MEQELLNGIKVSVLRGVEHRNHQAGQGLAHANFFFFAQAKHQAGHALGKGHAALQVAVD